jgi:hypothetical protein
MTLADSPRVFEYTIGWICALPVELTAATVMLDVCYASPLQHFNDCNIYTLGRIAAHKVAIACLPAGPYGTTSATRVAEQMRSTFPALRFVSMVGIGGGAPSDEHDIRLGDIVVSQPANGHGGVIHYRFGKTVSGQAFQHTSYFNKPPPLLLNAVAYLKSKHGLDDPSLSHHLSVMLGQREKLRVTFGYQGQENVDTISGDIDSDDRKAQGAFNAAVHLLHQYFPLQSEARNHMNENWAECELYITAFHDRYCKLLERTTLTLSYDFIELLYCCAW